MVVGHADVLSGILLRHVQDLQSLVVVLKLDFACWQVAALLEPLDGGGRPGWEGEGRDQTVDFELALLPYHHANHNLTTLCNLLLCFPKANVRTFSVKS